MLGAYGPAEKETVPDLYKISAFEISAKFRRFSHLHLTEIQLAVRMKSTE